MERDTGRVTDDDDDDDDDMSGYNRERVHDARGNNMSRSAKRLKHNVVQSLVVVLVILGFCNVRLKEETKKLR